MTNFGKSLEIVENVLPIFIWNKVFIFKNLFLHIVPVAGNGKDVLNGGSYLGKTFQSLMWTLVEVNLFILNNHLSVFQTKKKSWLCCIISWKYVSLGIAYQGLWGEQILEYQKDTMWNQTLSEAFLLMCRRWQFSHPERGIIRN